MTPEAELETDAELLVNCPCCGVATTNVVGYIYEQSATIVYKASFVEDLRAHDSERVKFVLSVGGWGEGTTENDRAAIVVDAVLTLPSLAFEFPSPKTSPFYGERILGKFWRPSELSEADRGRAIGEVRLALRQDGRLAGLLARRSISA